MNNNRRVEKSSSWVRWVGDMSAITEFLLEKSWLSPWCIPKTINSILRALGTVAFANNPITGVFILAGMFIGNSNVGYACLLGGVIGVLFSKLLRHDERLINDGVTVFNGILVGCIAADVVPGITGHEVQGIFWVYITVGIILTQYVDKGLNALMAPSSMPAFSIPFNLSAAILLLNMRSSQGLQGNQPPISLVPSDVILEETADAVLSQVNITQDELDWMKVMKGTLLAGGQIYGVGTVDSSILIYLGLFVYSPVLTLFLYIGSVIGTFIGAIMSAAPYTEVYLGLWGYNAMLTAGGISFFMVPIPAVTLAAIVGAVLAAGVQAASLHVFSTTMTPVFSYPFNVAMLLVSASSHVDNSPFQWVSNRTYPEKHFFLYYKDLKRRQNASDIDLENGEPLNFTTK